MLKHSSYIVPHIELLSNLYRGPQLLKFFQAVGLNLQHSFVHCRESCGIEIICTDISYPPFTSNILISIPPTGADHIPVQLFIVSFFAIARKHVASDMLRRFCVASATYFRCKSVRILAQRLLLYRTHFPIK